MNNAMFYAWMSQASYLYFNDSIQHIVQTKNDADFEFALSESKIDNTSDDITKKDKLLSQTQAKLFVEKYSFISHQENTYSGMSSTIFQSKEDNSYTFAMRGTEPSAQGGTDVFEDIKGIIASGKAKAQLADAFHYYKRLTTDKGEKVVYTEAEKEMMDKLGTQAAGVSFQNMHRDDTGLGEIEAGATINFTGHSLGGHLAYLLAEMVHQTCEGKYQIGDIMTYNAPGEQSVMGYLIDSLNIDLLFQDQYIANKHLAFYAEQGANVTAGFGDVVGTPKPVFIESDPSITGYFSMDNHSIAKLSDTLSVYNIFAKLDKDFYWDTSANNIDKALPVFNKIMEQSSSDDYNQTLETVLNKLDKLLDPSHSGELLENDKESFYQKVQRLTEKALEVKQSSFTEIEILDNIDNLTQAALQDKGIAYRYALKEFNIFALTGYDYSQHNQNGELNLYSPNNPNGMTQNYIQDRLAMFNALSKGAEQIYDDIATGTHLELSEELANGDYYSDHPEYTQRKIVFGTDGSDSNILGGTYADHLYGGAGNDILKGSFAEDNASDYLEGGKGFDTYHVGNGDSIFDADARGMIYFNGNLLGDFEQDKHNQSLWYELDKNSNQTDVAARKWQI